jgi:uncharacterized protein (DUF885 family)
MDLRAMACQRLGVAFDIAEFRHRVLIDGSVPLDTLEQIITEWVDGAGC